VSLDRSIAVGQQIPSAWSRSRVGAFLSQPVSWVFIVVGAIIAFLSLYPTVFLFYGSLTDAPLGVPGHFTLQNYVRAYSDPEAYPLLLNSFIFGIGSAGLSVVFALTLAWITIRTNAPLRRLFELTAIIPNILPPILVSISWVMLLNPSNGLINGFFVQLFGMDRGPFNIYSLTGLIFVEGLILTPLAFLIIAAALKSMDPSLEESAKTLGSGEFGIMRRITFPLIRPAILAAGTLNFVRAVESFDTPAIIALPARIEVFTTKIWREALGSFPTNHNLAAAYGVGILVIALLFVYLYRRFTSQVESFSTVTGKGFRPHQIDLGRYRYLASGVAFLLLILLVVLPLLVLLLVAILPYYHVPTWRTWQNLTFDHFRYIWATPRVHRAFLNSLFLALVGATACMLLASLASYISVRTKIAGRGLLEGWFSSPGRFPELPWLLGCCGLMSTFQFPCTALSGSS
jgi:iron(III) transport system permease protein